MMASASLPPDSGPPLCRKCGLEVSEGGLEVEGCIFHVACFTCDGCSKPLDGPYNVAGGQRFCDSCTPKTICAKCNQPIHLQCKKVDDLSFHPQCFCCDNCQTALSTFYPHDGKRLCANCVPQSFCTRCKGVISGLATRTDDGSPYHPDCFTCWHCSTPIHDSYLKDAAGNVFCGQDCLRAPKPPPASTSMQFSPSTRTQTPSLPLTGSTGSLNDTAPADTTTPTPPAPAPADTTPPAVPTTATTPTPPTSPPASPTAAPKDASGGAGTSPSRGAIKRQSTLVQIGNDSQDAQDVSAPSIVAGPSFLGSALGSLGNFQKWTTNLQDSWADAQSKLAANTARMLGKVGFSEQSDDEDDDKSEDDCKALYIWDIIDHNQSGEISKLKMLKAAMKNPEVAQFVLGTETDCSKVLTDNEDVFDALCDQFDTISQGRNRMDYTDFSTYFGANSCRLRTDTVVLRNLRLKRKVLIIGPGFGAKINPRQTMLVEAAGFQIEWVHVPNPEVPTFPVMQHLPQVKTAIDSFQPDVVVGASKGGVYVTALWQTGWWTGATLLLNAHPTCTKLPPNTNVVIAHGSNDEVYHRPRTSLEELMLSGTPGRRFLYYSANSGQMPDGRFTRFGDMHNMESLLQYNLLPRLIDAACCELGPEWYMLESWRDQLSNDRLMAEHKLGMTPELLMRFWQSKNKKGQDAQKRFALDPESDEYDHVATLFHSQPKDPPMYGGYSEAWPETPIVRIERVENGYQVEGNAKPWCESLRATIEAQGMRFTPGLHTRWCFHGTQAVDTIVNNPMQGFQPLAANRSVWGSGTYFARDAKYASDGGFCLQTAEGNQVLMCLLMTGMACLGDPIHRGVLPFSTSPHRYTCSVDSLNNPEIFVVQHPAAALPAYIITFVPPAKR